jgi:hypothetical protein
MVKYKKLFIIGCPRSGTSWVRLIFLNHPSVIGISSESHIYPIIMKPFLRLFRNESTDNGVWEHILERYDELAQNFGKKGFFNKSGHWVSGNGNLVGYVERKRLYEFIQQAKTEKGLSDIKRAQLVIDNIFDDFFIANGGTNKHLLVEKTPTHTFYAELILERYPEAKIIEVLRDGRDVCVSLEMLGKIQDWCPKKREGQIEMWKNHIEKGLELLSNKRFDRRVLIAQYEKLKEHPRREIKRMFEFAEIDNSPELVAQIAQATDFKNLKNIESGRHLRKGVVGDWKNHFTNKDIKLFKEMANDLLIKLGYKW